MKFIDFKDNFPNDMACQNELKRLRVERGIICKKCKGNSHYWIESKKGFQCKNNSCRFRTSLKSGTVMENSKLSVYQWFLAIHLMTASKMNISALELQKQIGHKYYEPIFEMAHKLRIIMGKRDSLYKLDGLTELDEGYFSHTNQLDINDLTGKREELKRGKGSQKKSTILVMHSVEQAPLNLEKKKNKHDTKAKFLKMSVIDDVCAETIDKEVVQNLNLKITLNTDDNKAYKNLKKIVTKHNPYKSNKVNIGKILPWVHKAISNSKAILLAVHHGVSKEYMQNYLNEFCFKYNRRYFGEKLFSRLLIASISTTWF